MQVKLTNYTPNPITAIERAACNCYDSKPCGGRIAKGCYDSGHLAVFEFASFTFHISGVSRALLAQLTRHRMAGFAVRSQRYCSEDQSDFVYPQSIAKNELAHKAYTDGLLKCKEVYEYLQSLGIPNEDARYILPSACETTLEFTCNGRELIHIMNERLCTRAQWEIRELFTLIKKALQECGDEEVRQFAEYCRPKCEKNLKFAYCPEHNSCGRHPKFDNVKK